MDDKKFIQKMENHKIFQFSFDFVISQVQLCGLPSQALRIWHTPGVSWRATEDKTKKQRSQNAVQWKLPIV